MIAPAPALRTVAVGSVIALLVGWMVTADPAATPADAAVPLPSGSETFLVSRTNAGASTDPYVTPDGQNVAFVSTATDLTPVSTGGVANIFLSTAIQGSNDPFSGAATLVSAADASFGTAAGNAASTQPVMSADGRYVVFTSTATNLVTEASTPGVQQVYIRDMNLGTTIRLEGAAVPNGASYDPDISDDGRYVVFTSTATNLPSGDASSVADTNGAPDTFIADLDPDGNGRHDSVSISRLLNGVSVPGGTTQARISGNGAEVIFTAQVDLIAAGQPFPAASGNHLFRADRTARADATLLATGTAHDGSIDSTGNTVAYIDDTVCTDPTVMAATIAGTHVFPVSVARSGTWLGIGTSGPPVISSNGERVAFATTTPLFEQPIPPVEPPPLANPVIRVADIISWIDTPGALECSPSSGTYFDGPVGDAVSLSASGRTIVLSGPSTQSTATAAVSAIDTHLNNGLSVSSTIGSLATPGFVTGVEIADIPLAELPNYSAALANAPIYRLPIYRLPIYRLPIYRLPIYRLMVDDSPIYRLPIYRLPIYRLPIYRLDIPGGWTQLLQNTPFADIPQQNVTLDQVLKWAADTIANPPANDQAALDAAKLIQTLTINDIDMTGSGLESLSLASMIMGNAPLSKIPAGDTTAAIAHWQSLVDAQGIPLTVDDQTVLAELDSAGLDISKSGVESIPLNQLASLPTLMDTIPLKSLILSGTPLGALDVSELDAATRTALFGPDVTAGTLQYHIANSLLDPNATVQDLAAGTPDSITLGALLFSLVDADSYPWEQIDPATVNRRAVMSGTPGDSCLDGNRCGHYTQFQFTFDPGPGEPTQFAAPTASIQLPAGTAQAGSVTAGGSGPQDVWLNTTYGGPQQQDGALQRFPLADMPGGTVLSLQVYYDFSAKPGDSQSVGTLTSGSLSADDTVYGRDDVSTLDNPNNNRVNGQWAGFPTTLLDGVVYYENISPQYKQISEFNPGTFLYGPADDEDWYEVMPPGPNERLVISTNASDGQLSLSLYSQNSPGTPLGTADASAAPGTAVTEQNTSTAADPAESGADAGTPVQGATLVDQAVVGGDGVAEISAASTDAAAGQPMLVRVTSGNGQRTTSLYSIRAHYVPEAPEQVCLPYAPAQTADPGVVGTSDPVTADTNTVYLFDQKRYGDAYGSAAATEVLDALHSMTGKGHVGSGTVQGAVLSIDSDPGVASARTALDANPCSMSHRGSLTAAINSYVKTALGFDAGHISSIVLVGGDDMIPLAPVAQHTSQFNEASHASDLKLAQPLAGGTCPTGLADGQVDPCATPLSAAAATNHVLTDDPYGLAKAYRSLGGFLYVPTVGVGRLIEKPAQIEAEITRFTSADGQLAADSAVTGGYGAWAELPAAVTDKLDWRVGANDTTFTTPWTKNDVDAAVFNAPQSPRVVSLNTHADERLMLPGVSGAASGVFTQDDLLTATGRTDDASLNGALVFQIGCHAGNNLPTAYYGDVPDWADVFSSAGGYVGNTGYGLASDTTTALSERLLSLYAGWVGTAVNGTKVSSASALMYAKQSYLGGLGLYSGYDEKALMEAVYYGLPMYTFGGDSQDAPVPAIPADLSPVAPGTDGVLSASLHLSPTFSDPTPAGSTGATYLTANGQEPLAVAGQPVLPKIVSQLRAAPSGSAARGVLVTGLTSTQVPTDKPAIAEPTIGTGEGALLPAGGAFPSSLATLSSQLTPSGDVDTLVVTPARVAVGRDGKGVTEKFTSMDLSVIYGPSNSTDTTPPVISATELLGDTMRATIDGTGSDVKRVVMLVQHPGSDGWDTVELTHSGSYWESPSLGTDDFRWILQAADAAGNVVTDSDRGRVNVANVPAPTGVDMGGDVTLHLGDRLLRSAVVQGVDADTDVTGSYEIADANGQIVDGGPAVVAIGDDGKRRVTIDKTITAVGTFTLTLDVCTTGGCKSDSFTLSVPPRNTAPTATAGIASSTATITPTTILTAVVTTHDDEGDHVYTTLQWLDNGVAIPGSYGQETLDLTGKGQAGDVISLVVTTNDGTVDGTTARAEVTVGKPAGALAPPTIVAHATNAAGAYTEGDWSRTPVTVSFTCQSGAGVISCPSDEVVSTDTSTTGHTVSGSVTDGLGRTVTTTFLVRVDQTPPVLAPTVTPSTVDVGGTATAAANATDAASGIASQSCTQPDTSTAGTKSVSCTATDVAGNTATGTAPYTVNNPRPAAPTITAVGTETSGPYAEGTWANLPVKVTFTCTSGVAVVSCTTPITTSKDTGPNGVMITGKVKDSLGRTAQVSFLVKLDRTPPKLAPTVTPKSFPVGGTAVVSANATDSGSGVASQSCGALITTKAGTYTVTCIATDYAGNSATASTSYTVTVKRTS